jgi:hypothetical protein
VRATLIADIANTITKAMVDANIGFALQGLGARRCGRSVFLHFARPAAGF